MSEREFVARVLTVPPVPADCVVVLTGDGEARLATAVSLLRARVAPKVLVSGGVMQPPYAVDAEHLTEALRAKGVPDALVMPAEMASQNTKESAVNMVVIARQLGWRRILLVTSAYHLPRAVLSFVRALNDAQSPLVVIPVAETLSWSDVVPGRAMTRAALFAEEAEKIEQYSADIASYREGLDYLNTLEAL